MIFLVYSFETETKKVSVALEILIKIENDFIFE